MSVVPNVTRARKHVILYDAREPGEYREVPLNPETLPLDVSVNVGKLAPIGYSHSVQQYGSTGSMTFPLELYVSDALRKRTPHNTRTVQDTVDWVMSFCYCPEPGIAPCPLGVIWPGLLSIITIVASARVEYSSFYADLKPKAAKISLSLEELRSNFKTHLSHYSYGFTDRLEPPIAEEFGDVYSPVTGTPLILGPARSRRG